MSLLAILLISQQCLSAAQVSCLKAVQDDSQIRELVDNIDDIRLLPRRDLYVSTQALILSIENYYGPKKLKKTTIGLSWKKKKADLYKKFKTSRPSQYCGVL